MRIIPVLDLMGGQVVQAIRGERERYRPVQSCLVSTAEPLAVTRALQEETGCGEFYVADLDAIRGQSDQLTILRQLATQVGAAFWVDAAITDAASALRTLEAGASKVIVGSESLPSIKALRAIRAVIPAQRLLLSLDIAKGRVLSQSPTLANQPPLDALAWLVQEGWSEIILLTLDRVGTENGPDWPLLKVARRRFPSISLIAGGGVRNPGDLQELAALGVNGTLVATALHRGRITAHDLRLLR